MKAFIRKIKNKVFKKNKSSTEMLIEIYHRNGQIPWSDGYVEFKEKSIIEAIQNANTFSIKELPENYGYRLDERIVEYPWTLDLLSNNKSKILDAGSVLNYEFIINHPKFKEKELYIQTFYPESNCFWNKRVSYVYEDLRNIPFKDCFFNEIVCISTLEHIDMDNSIYGYKEKNTRDEKSYEYLKAVTELIRVLKPGGKLLVTFPFGKYEYQGFFQQFDEEMLNKIVDSLEGKGIIKIVYFKYEKTGWRFAEMNELSNVQSYNPHTGKGKSDDGAAHCRSIACIEFIKTSE